MWREVSAGAVGLSLRILTPGMRPVIGLGDVVKVSGAEPARVGTGDILAF
jgi:hypothetical protein